MVGFSVREFEEIPVMPDGYKQVQRRDERGRFISGFDIVPDPDWKPDPDFVRSVGKVYLIEL